MQQENTNLISNINLSELKATDLLMLATSLKNLLLEYRQSLNLERKVRFGIELEYEGIDKSQVREFMRKSEIRWQSESDETLSSGGEIISPKLADERQTWEHLKKLCNYLKCQNADTMHNAGLHIHVGAHILGDNIDYWQRFAKIYTLYERVIIRFGYGDKVGARRTLFNYAKPIGYKLLEKVDLLNKNASLNNLKEFYNVIYNSKENAINLRSMEFLKAIVSLNTIEFRNFNSSTEEAIIQNDINTACKLITCATKDIDEDFLDYKLKKLASLTQKNYLEQCSQILMREMAEFADLIFDNTQDKLYFMKQYIRDFESSNASELKIVRGLVK